MTRRWRGSWLRTVVCPTLTMMRAVVEQREAAGAGLDTVGGDRSSGEGHLGWDRGTERADLGAC